MPSIATIRHCVSTPRTASEFLSSFPPPALYTTARTLGPGSLCVFDLPMHLSRLTHLSPNPDELKRQACQTMLRALQHEDLYVSSACKLVTVVTADSQVSTYCESLPSAKRVSPVIQVSLAQHPRSNPTIKDLNWVEERKAIVSPTCEETLLVDAAGSILEGASSNFFVVLPDGQCQTAAHGCLLGTVRSLVLEACAALDIPVLLQAPRMDQVSLWSECFITSTSRLVLAIDRVGETSLPPPPRPVTARIAAWVTNHLSQHATSLL